MEYLIRSYRRDFFIITNVHWCTQSRYLNGFKLIYCSQDFYWNCLVLGDWSAFTNFSKLGLAVFSIGFDILFIIQHYVCYPSQKKPEMVDLIMDSNIQEFEDYISDTTDSYSSVNASDRSFTLATNLFRHNSHSQD